MTLPSRLQHALLFGVTALVLVPGCKVERVGDVTWDPAVSAPSRLPELPAIPSMNASEESLESVVRDELARMRAVDDPLELVRLRVEELGLSPAGRAGGWYFPVEVERVSTVGGSLALLPEAATGADSEASAGEGPQPEAEAQVLPGAHLRRRKEGNWEKRARLVRVKHGLRDPATGWDDYAGVSVAGAIAVVDWGAPPQMRAAQGWSDQHLIDLKLEAALQAGAAGCIVRVPEIELARVGELMPLSVDAARERDEPPAPKLEFEALVSEAVKFNTGASAAVSVQTHSEWATHRLLLARVVGAEQAELNVTVVVEPDPEERELAIYEASSIAALARQLHGYARRGVRLRRSVTVAVLPLGAPVDEMARALLERGPLPPQNMSAAIVLRDFVGAAASHQVRLFGAEASVLGERVEQVGLPLGWSFARVQGEDGQRAFLSAGVPAISLARTGDMVPADASHWAESLVAETRLLLRIVLGLAREVEPIRLRDPALPAPAPGSTPATSPQPEPEPGSDAARTGPDTIGPGSADEAGAKGPGPTP